MGGIMPNTNRSKTHQNHLKHPKTPEDTPKHPETPENTPEHPKTPENSLKHTKIPENIQKHPKTHENTPKPPIHLWLTPLFRNLVSMKRWAVIEDVRRSKLALFSFRPLRLKKNISAAASHRDSHCSSSRDSLTSHCGRCASKKNAVTQSPWLSATLAALSHIAAAAPQ